MFSVFRRFLISHGASSFATGVHFVLLAWIAMQEMQLSPLQWGFIQAFALVPSLLLMPVAGAWADRYDPAKVLAAAQGLLTLSYLFLLAMLSLGMAEYQHLLAYALFVGVGQAFVQPVREKLLTEIPSGSVQKRISLLSIVQFSLQSAGIGLAALSETMGITLVLGVQGLVSLMSALLFLSLRKSDQQASTTHNTFSDIGSGFRFIIGENGLKQLMALVAFNGYMHMGVFLVMVPLVATRVYQQSASEYAGLQLLFVLGMIVSHVFLHRQKTVEYPGQGALFSLLYTALIGFGLAKQPTPFGFYFLILAWGLVAGNSAGRCRLILQSLSPKEMKGRVMSVYQLMLFGAAPVGALVTGVVLKVLTYQQIFFFMSGSSIVLFAVFLMTRTLWAVQQAEEDTKDHP